MSLVGQPHHTLAGGTRLDLVVVFIGFLVILYTVTGGTEAVTRVLVESRDRVAGKAELMSRLWPEHVVEESNLTQQVFTLRKALGDHVFNAFIANKKIEWDRYRIHVTDYELTRYLPIL